MVSLVEVDFCMCIQDWLFKIVLVLFFVVMLFFVYGFIFFIVFLLFIGFKMLLNYVFVGWENYCKFWVLENWYIVIVNIGIFVSFYIIICIVFGFMFVIFFDQKICGEGVLWLIYFYLMVLFFIVMGMVWKWFFDLGIGFEYVMYFWGWESFFFIWIKDNNMVIYMIVIVVVWQISGFVMVMFFVGFCGIDNEILKVVQIDGVLSFQFYCCIVILMFCLVFFLFFVILSYFVIKFYDFVIVLMGGGFGWVIEMLVIFMYFYIFICNQMGIGVVFVVIMLMIIVVIMVFYFYVELKEKL